MTPAGAEAGRRKGEGGPAVQDYIWKRVLDVSNHIFRTKDTVRETAMLFGVSKSTVHKDVTERLPRVNPELAAKVKQVLEFNKAERHIRGGAATRQKYLER
jgi:putative DeoR family transcriptional regulator (stage III sporulation protein D)